MPVNYPPRGALRGTNSPHPKHFPRENAAGCSHDTPCRCALIPCAANKLPGYHELGQSGRLLLLFHCLLALPCAAQLPNQREKHPPPPPRSGHVFRLGGRLGTIDVNGQKHLPYRPFRRHQIARDHAQGGRSRARPPRQRYGPPSLPAGLRHLEMENPSSASSTPISKMRSRPEREPVFTLEQFQQWTANAKELKHHPKLPVKSYSQTVWGDLDIRCRFSPLSCHPP